MAYQSAESFAPSYAQTDDTSTTHKLHEDYLQTLSDAGKYESAENTADLHQLEFVDSSKDFQHVAELAVALGSEPGSVNLTAPKEAAQVTPQQDGGFFGVAGDIIGGGIQQFSNPLDWGTHLLVGAAITAGICIAGIAAAPIIATAPAWLPVAGMVGLAAGAIGLTGWSLAEHMPQWIKDGEVVWNASKYSAEEVAKAHEGLRGIGAGGVNLIADVVGGGFVYGKMGGAVKQAFEAASANIAAKTTAAESATVAVDSATAATKSATVAAEGTATVSADGAAALAADMSTDAVEAAAKEATARAVVMAEKAGMNDYEYLYSGLDNPEDIVAIARDMNNRSSDPLGMVFEIQSMAERNVLNPNQKGLWLELAKEFESKAMKTMQSSLQDGTLPNFERTVFPKMLDDLKAGKSADEITAYFDRMADASKAKREKAFGFTEADEIKAFVARNSETTPNFRNEIETAIAKNQIPAETAEAWRAAINSMPENGLPTLLSNDPEAIKQAGMAALPRIQAMADNAVVNPHEFIYTTLSDPSEIAAYARLANQEMNNPIRMAKTIRGYMADGLINPKTKEVWTALANEFEAQIPARLETALSNPDLTDLDRFILPKILEQLKAGKPTPELYTEYARLSDAAYGGFNKAAKLTQPDEIEAFLIANDWKAPLFRDQIDSFISFNNIPEETANVWRNVLNDLPPVENSMHPRALSYTGDLRQFRSKNFGLLKPDESALANLTDPNEIASFSKDWAFDEFGDANFADKIRTALQHNDVVPGTEAAWTSAISTIEHEAAIRLTYNVSSAVSKASTYDEMLAVLKAYPSRAREVELALKTKQLYIADDLEQTWAKAIDDFMVSPEGTAAKQQAAFYDATVSTPARTGDELWAALKYQSESSLLNSRTYALTHLTDRKEILEFVNGLPQSTRYDRVNQAHNILRAVEDGLVMPGTERVWKRIAYRLQQDTAISMY